MRRRVFSGLLVMSMMISMLASAGTPVLASGGEGPSREGTGVDVVFMSDLHNGVGGYPGFRQMVSELKDEGQNPRVFSHGGDYVEDSQGGSVDWQTQVYDVIHGTELEAFPDAEQAYTLGNHDWESGTFGGASDKEAAFKAMFGFDRCGLAYADDEMEIYMIGAQGETGSGGGGEAFIQSDIDAFDEYLSGVEGNGKVIFLQTHWPGHSSYNFRQRVVTNSDKLIDVINSHSAETDIVWIWGHNHYEDTMRYVILQPGDQIMYSADTSSTWGNPRNPKYKTIDFTYANCGCMNDMWYKQDGHNDTSAGNNYRGPSACLSVTVDDGTISFMYNRIQEIDGVWTYAHDANVNIHGTIHNHPATVAVERRAADHQHDYVQVSVVAPTCTEGGYTIERCSICDRERTVSPTEALGHDWDDGVITVEATTEHAGVMTYTCRRCGETRTARIPRIYDGSMTDIDFTDPDDADKFEIVGQENAAIIAGAGVSLITSQGGVEPAKQNITETPRDVIEVPVTGDWNATLTFEFDQNGAANGYYQFFGFYACDGEDYQNMAGIRGGDSAMQDFLRLNGIVTEEMNSSSPGLTANGIYWYRIEKSGDSYACFRSSDGEHFSKMFAFEATGIEADKLVIDAYTGMTEGYKFTLKSLTFDNEQTVDFTALEQAIAAAEAIDPAAFTEESVTAMQAVLAEARAARSADSQAAADAAAASLLDAISALEPKTEEPVEGTYVLAQSITPGTPCVIVADGAYAMNNTEVPGLAQYATGSTTRGATAVTIEGNRITSAVYESMLWIFEDASSSMTAYDGQPVYFLRDASGKYLQRGSMSNQNSGLILAESLNETMRYNTWSFKDYEDEEGGGCLYVNSERAYGRDFAARIHGSADGFDIPRPLVNRSEDDPFGFMNSNNTSRIRFYVKSDGETPITVDRTALNRAIAAAENINRIKYTDETLAILDAAVAGGRSLGDDATQEEVDEAATAINAAISGLVKKDVMPQPCEDGWFLTDDIETGKTYVIVADDQFALNNHMVNYGTYADGNTTLGSTPVTVDDGRISTGVSGDMLWTIGPAEDVQASIDGRDQYFIFDQSGRQLLRRSGSRNSTAPFSVGTMDTSKPQYATFSAYQRADGSYTVYVNSYSSSDYPFTMSGSNLGFNAPGVSRSNWRPETYGSSIRLYEFVEGIGHVFGEWTVSKEPTCTEKGEECRVCERCGGTETRDVEALGHDEIDHEAKAPTCTEKGWSIYQTCSRCDYTTYEEIDALGHDWGDWNVTTAPTCTESGIGTRSCSRCDAEETGEVEALGHDLKNHEAKAPTCTEKGWNAYQTCTRCDYTTYEELSALGHYLIDHESKAPTCTEFGWNAYQTCTRCDFTTYEEIEALDHDYEAVVTAPTCREPGYTTYTCSRCGDSYTADESVALGHDLIDHEAKAPTCTETGWNAYQTCTRCGDTTYEELPALGHQPGEAIRENEIAPSCLEKGSYDEIVYCAVCGELLSRETKDTAALGHNWREWKVTTEPTCTESGIETRICERCNAEETREVDALGHALVNHEAKEPTCLGKGWNAYQTCTRCDYTTYEELPALGHSWGEWKVTTKPTCTQSGIETRICDRCNAAETRELDALGHYLIDYEAKAPTCTEKGWNAYQACTRCDFTTCEEIEALGHDYQTEVTAPTCTESGYTTYTCSRCGDSYAADETAALDHDWGGWTVTAAPTCTESGSETRMCSRCDAAETREADALGHDLIDHEAKAPTCTEKGWNAYQTCTRCDYKTYEELPALGHQPGEAIRENEIAPTCLEKGCYDEVVYCTVCGDQLSRETEDTAALGHSWRDWEVTMEPTCTESGVETRICERCNAEETCEVEALGHDLMNHEAKAPTCTEKGWNAYETCSRCDHTTYEEMPALGHDLTHHDTKAATCTEIGWNAYDACSRCDYTTYEELPALGHNLRAHEEKAPTCTEPGWNAYETCSRCDYTTYKELPALGHQPGEAIRENETAPTCLETGSYDEVIYCAVCGELLSRETKDTAALGHSWNDWKVTTNPTCTESGVETRTCVRCDTEESREVNALGHNLVNHEAKEPTCTEKGWNAYQTCTRCDYTTYEELPAVGHQPGEAVRENELAPTCTENGRYDEVVYCTVCAEQLNRETKDIAALGHSWRDWEVTTEPTCTESGVETRACERCSAKETREVDALGHDLIDHEAKAPTCTEEGWNAYQTCSRCGYTTYEEIDALGHDWSDWTLITAPACEDKGIEARNCSRCDAAETREVDALGHELIVHEAKAPTCTEKGWNAYETCTRCGYTTYEELPALGHQPGEAIRENETAPTCLETGSYDEVIYCAVCGELLSRETKDTAALGHDWREWKVTTEPTCTESGIETWICERCNAEETREVDAIGHALVNHEAKEPTCTGKGWNAYQTCTRCDYTTYEELPALGHSWGEWEVTTKPTCTQSGIETRICERCNTAETRELDALGHYLIDHEAKAPTCTEKGWNAYQTCTRCGFTTCEEIEALGHDYQTEVTAPTCTESGYTTYTCSRCGDSYAADETAALDHDWGGWTVTAAPTCTESGSETRTCSRCDAAETREADALGHDLIDHEAKAPTCTEKGWNAYQTCTRCDFKTYEELPALGHQPGEAVRENEIAPTCLEKGSYDEVVYCAVCAEQLRRETKQTPALGHDWTLSGWTWDEYKSASATFTCSNDGSHVQTVQAEIIERRTEPTCETDGSILYTAVAVWEGRQYSDSKSRIIQRQGHLWGEPTYTWSQDNSEVTAEAVCLRDSTHRLTQTVYTGAVSEDATCTEPGTVVFTAAFNGSPFETQTKRISGVPLGHAWSDWIVTVEPTCTEKGSKERTCSRCGAKETVEMDALGHDLVDHEAKAPTCTEIGWNAYQTCTRCDYTTYEELHITRHTLASPVKENEVVPTCTEEGSYDEVVYCAVCHTEISRETKVFAALGHDYKATVTEPTCTEKGYTTYFCSRCGNSYQADETPALGHAFGEWTQTKAPTCTEKGEEKRTCSRCGKEETRQTDAIGHELIDRTGKAPTCTEKGWNDYQTCTRCDYTTYAEIAALGHSWSDWEVTTEPTCTEKGAETRTCTRCHENETRETDAIGHSLVEHEAKAPTCTEIGWNAYQSCTQCDYTTYEELAATGHKPGEAVLENETAPTCTEKGSYDEVIYCTVCGEQLSRETKEAAALGHSWSKWTVMTEPTCTVKGEEKHTCSRCGAEETREADALGHDLVDHEAKTPTCTEIGWNAYQTCTRCEFTTLEELPAAGHKVGTAVRENEMSPTCTEKGSYDDVVCCTVCREQLSRDVVEVAALGHDYKGTITAPTCTEKGYTTYICTRCKDSYRAEETAALGHDYGEWTPIKAPTCTEKGEENHVCARCDAAENREVAALGHALVDHEAKAPTCTEEGWNAYQTCSRCEFTTFEVIPPTGHSFADGVCAQCGAKDPDYVTPADKTALNNAIAAAEAVDPKRCTEDTVKALTDTLEKAKKIQAKEDAAQAEVDAATKALNDAIDALEPFLFDDVKDPVKFYFDPIYWAFYADPQITNGMDATHFGPDNACTRGHVVTFLWRAAGCPEPKSSETPFKDLKKGAFYEKAVAWAVEEGITKGVSDDKFAPDQTCTRGQIVTFLWRFKGEAEPKSTKTLFTDLKKGAFYEKAVAWAVENEVTNGMTATTFGPDATCTRGQVVTFLNRAMK